MRLLRAAAAHHTHIDNVTHLRQTVRPDLLCPRPVCRRHRCAHVANLHRHLRRRNLRDQRVKVRAILNGLGPVRMFVRLQVLTLGDHILQAALPSMPALIGGESIQHRLLRGVLQVQVERRIHAQARAVDLIGAVLALQLPSHLFDKIWRLCVGGRLQI